MEALYGSHWILTLLLAIPLVGAVACVAGGEGRARWTALLTTLLVLALSLPLFWTFRIGTAEFQNAVSLPWIERWGIRYAIGMDGISLLMILLTTVIMPISIAGSFSYIKTKERAFYASMLVLMTGMLGVFVALDLFLFYVFWEIMLIPMYLIIGIWGGKRRIYSAVKFFLFTAAGSLLMLVAIVVLVYLHQQQTGVSSFVYADLIQTSIAPGLQLLLFAAFGLAFAIKVPLFPFHTWLPDAHVEAPTAGSVILAGILLKMGVYGFLRFAMPLFPVAATSLPVIGTIVLLGLVGIIYAAWVAAVQPDAKKLIAYTSVAHLGFVMVGLFALNSQGVSGAILQMVNHGISTGALFLLVGMIYERRHTRLIADFGGLAKVMPFFAFALTVVALSSIGLPGTNGFVGEFLILVGAFQRYPLVAVLATTGVVFAAAYMLPMVQRIILNPLTQEENRELDDLNARERWILWPLLALILLIGVFPQPFLDRMSASVDGLIENVQTRRLPSQASRGPDLGANELRLAPTGERAIPEPDPDGGVGP
ncbi:MAG: NADH-quinone oxidoreductase subunit M [Gemmatimonadota bacterium]|jgi:NADH-quinone oxidoreductase subunit M|nr:MAG: NADH-quinone oxidoreductase subunit M [Gemmatimonadota bacterium]